MDFAYKNMIARNFIRLNHKQQCEILAVRNIESVRKFMLDSKIISEKEHFRFIESLKEAKNMAYFGVYECENNENSFRANSACSDFLGSASPHSLQRTASASHSSASHEANSSLGNHCIDLANFEHSQTHSLASHSKFAKNYTSKTADTRILGETQSDSADSMESNAESSENNPVIARLDEVKSWQSTVENNPHEVPPNLAPLRGAEKEEKGGSSASALLELEAENSDYINENNLAESRRIERAESTESFKDSNILDCHANPYGLSRNDGIGVDCHEFNKLNSRNDDSSLTVFVRKSAGLTKQSIYDSTENDFKDSIDCLVPNWLCNYDSMAIPYNADSRNDDSLSSLRGSEATEAIHLNSFCNSDSKNIIHSHDSITQNLALITKNASTKSQESSLQNDNSQLTLLGVVCFNHIDFANKNAFFGIYSIPDKKNGANLLAMLEFIAFEVLNLHALYAKVLSTNARALNFYAKHNFTHCGKMPNAIRRDGRFLDIEILAKFKERV